MLNFKEKKFENQNKFLRVSFTQKSKQLTGKKG